MGVEWVGIGYILTGLLGCITLRFLIEWDDRIGIPIFLFRLSGTSIGVWGHH
jgi:hypothetical protein